MTSITVF